MTSRPRTRSRLRRAARAALWALAATALAPTVALGVLAARTPIPPELLGEPEGGPADRNSVTITDRSGTILAELRDEGRMRQRRLPLEELGPTIERAILAAEDARFYAHPGIDPLAMARAAATSLIEGRVVSGASTLTQQLARTLLSAPRTVRAKVDVMALAVRLEATFTKRRILEEYLNRVEFGPNVRGVEAASQLYFGKSVASLSLAEAAALASIPRGPSLYDPFKRPELLRARRDRVLERMASHDLASPEEVARAKGEPLVVGPRFRRGSAPHFVAALEQGGLDPCGSPQPIPSGAVEIRTTLIADLQREVEQSARATLRELSSRAVTAASVVVLANETGDVLAYLGSPDVDDEARLGANDGCRARRQPGSTLKPFVYGLALERLGMTPATLLPDVELSFVGADGGAFRPKNYDERFHGPVLMRQSLGSSLNVPAVWLTERLGPSSVLERLHDVGMCSLDRPPSHYGVALALGDGEVTLVELASAYATLARGGGSVRPRAVLEVSLGDGSRVEVPPVDGPKVLDPAATELITDMLADPRARMASFGERTVFDLPFRVAAKTGTSKGFRDNWAVGYTESLTVAVWVGNFDGSPMREVSGITGAGPLFRAVMSAAARFIPPGELARPRAPEVEICPLSGRAAGPHCPHTKQERIPEGAKLGSCQLHTSVLIDTLTGELAGPSCQTDVEARAFEAYPPLFMPWARTAKRPLAPTTHSLRCPGPKGTASLDVRVLYPEDGAQFFLDGGARAHIRAVATFPNGAGSPAFVLDGSRLKADAEGAVILELTAGRHTLHAEVDDHRSDPVTFEVE